MPVQDIYTIAVVSIAEGEQREDGCLVQSFPEYEEMMNYVRYNLLDPTDPEARDCVGARISDVQKFQDQVDNDEMERTLNHTAIQNKVCVLPACEVVITYTIISMVLS
jgi:hypothetical protein